MKRRFKKEPKEFFGSFIGRVVGFRLNYELSLVIVAFNLHILSFGLNRSPPFWFADYIYAQN